MIGKFGCDFKIESFREILRSKERHEDGGCHRGHGPNGHDAVGDQGFSVRRSFGEYDGSDDGVGAREQKYVCLLVARIGRPKTGLELVGNEPGLGLNVEPDSDVTEGLEEEEGNDGEERKKGQQMSHRPLFSKRMMRAAIADHDDG